MSLKTSIVYILIIIFLYSFAYFAIIKINNFNKLLIKYDYNQQSEVLNIINTCIYEVKDIIKKLETKMELVLKTQILEQYPRNDTNCELLGDDYIQSIIQLKNYVLDINSKLYKTIEDKITLNKHIVSLAIQVKHNIYTGKSVDNLIKEINILCNDSDNTNLLAALKIVNSINVDNIRDILTEINVMEDKYNTIIYKYQNIIKITKHNKQNEEFFTNIKLLLSNMQLADIMAINDIPELIKPDFLLLRKKINNIKDLDDALSNLIYSTFDNFKN